MNINMISTKQLRENFEMVKQGIEEGLSFILIYRSRPLAEIRPIERKETQFGSSKVVNRIIEAELKQVEKLAGGFKFGKNLTAEQINRVIEKQYEEGFNKMLS
jgi:hypothetical protein